MSTTTPKVRALYRLNDLIAAAGTHHRVRVLTIGLIADVPSNVAYQELNLPDDFDGYNEVMRSLMPYACYSPSSGLPSRVVALVATRDIPEGTEILSSYLTLVGS